MGCSPSQNGNGTIEIHGERVSSNKATVSYSNELENIQSFAGRLNPSLFIIIEENSKYEESRIGSNLNFDYSKIESIKDN